MNLLNILLPLAITAIGGYLTTQITKAVPSMVKLIITKIGLANYQKMQIIALDIWKAIEEDGRLGQLVDSKINTFEIMIKKQFPNITDDDIKLLNKSIAGEVNKGKEAVTNAANTVSISQDQLTTLQAKAAAYDQIQNTVTTAVSASNTATPTITNLAGTTTQVVQ